MVSISMCCRNADRNTGANEVLIALNTEAGKVAYLVHAIAVELYNADKSIDSTAGLTLLTLAKDHC